MNIALSTFILFLLLIPGISFRKAYNFGPKTKRASKLSAFDDFIWAIIPGFIFQLSAAYLINAIHPYRYEVNFTSLGKILTGEKDSYQEFFFIEKNLKAILLYNIALATIAGLVGFLARKLIERRQWDVKYLFLRFGNEWHYILRGESKYFGEDMTRKERKKKNPSITTCTVNAVVRSDQGICYLYSGPIKSFYLSKDGTLDTILLKQAWRKKFTDPDESGLEIKTDFVLLKYSEIITLSVDTVNQLFVDREGNRPDPDKSNPVANNNGGSGSSLEERISAAKIEIATKQTEANNAGQKLSGVFAEAMDKLMQLNSAYLSNLQAQNQLQSAQTVVVQLEAQKKPVSNSEETGIKKHAGE